MMTRKTKKDIKTAKTWDEFKSFASNLLQVTPQDLREVEAASQDEESDSDEEPTPHA